MLKGAGKIKLEEKIQLNNIQGGDYCVAEIVEKKEEGKCLLKVEMNKPAEEVLEEIGFAPVPPYIRRDAD
jgi:S-adenosylmethionine:tRNA ribosyltransferase-isomerase